MRAAVNVWTSDDGRRSEEDVVGCEDGGLVREAQVAGDGSTRASEMECCGWSATMAAAEGSLA